MYLNLGFSKANTLLSYNAAVFSFSLEKAMLLLFLHSVISEILIYTFVRIVLKMLITLVQVGLCSDVYKSR